MCLCETGLMVKIERQLFMGLLHHLLLPDWKWYMLIMGLLIGILESSFMKNNIWVIMDCIAKLKSRGHAQDLCLAREEKKIEKSIYCWNSSCTITVITWAFIYHLMKLFRKDHSHTCYDGPKWGSTLMYSNQWFKGHWIK